MTLSWAGLGGIDVCCGLVGLAGGVGARTGGAQGADRTCVWQSRNPGGRRSLSRRLVVWGRAQNRLASGRAGGAWLNTYRTDSDLPSEFGNPPFRHVAGMLAIFASMRG